jgi:hypothetical protein
VVAARKLRRIFTTKKAGIDLPVIASSIAVLGFANYSTPGPHRVEFVTSGSEFVDMGEDGVHVPKTIPAPVHRGPPRRRCKRSALTTSRRQRRSRGAFNRQNRIGLRTCSGNG